MGRIAVMVLRGGRNAAASQRPLGESPNADFQTFSFGGFVGVSRQASICRMGLLWAAPSVMVMVGSSREDGLDRGGSAHDRDRRSGRVGNRLP